MADGGLAAVVALLSNPPWAAGLAAFLLVFCRIGAVLAVFPGYSASFISARTRLMAALALSWALQSLVLPVSVMATLTAQNVVPPAGMLATEILLGLMIGTTARLIETALGMACALTAQASGLSNIFDPHVESGGGTGLSVLVSLAAMAAFFASNGHLIIVKVLVNSYNVLPFNSIPNMGEVLEHIVNTVTQSFNLALQLALPFLILGWAFNIALGFANRLMPQLAVFFIGQPVAVLMGLVLMILVVPLWLPVWLDVFNNVLVGF